MQSAPKVDIHAPVQLGLPTDFFSKFSLNVNPMENSQGLSIRFENASEVQNISTNLISSNISTPTQFVQSDIQTVLAQQYPTPTPSTTNLISSNVSSPIPTPFVQPHIQSVIAQSSTPITNSPATSVQNVFDNVVQASTSQGPIYQWQAMNPPRPKITGRLTDLEKNAILAKRRLGLKHRQIAESLNRSMSTVSTFILREKLKNGGRLPDTQLVFALYSA